jgi:hypothetical protein
MLMLRIFTSLSRLYAISPSIAFYSSTLIGGYRDSHTKTKVPIISDEQPACVVAALWAILSAAVSVIATCFRVSVGSGTIKYRCSRRRDCHNQLLASRWYLACWTYTVYRTEDSRRMTRSDQCNFPWLGCCRHRFPNTSCLAYNPCQVRNKAILC